MKSIPTLDETVQTIIRSVRSNRSTAPIKSTRVPIEVFQSIDQNFNEVCTLLKQSGVKLLGIEHDFGTHHAVMTA